ncbi:MAG TPA: hypothetical protein VEZ11_03130 [Thermoanaerobaculia bacterium]|nr:hypothetical protein [Thermoanaerobaculia bacterium]
MILKPALAFTISFAAASLFAASDAPPATQGSADAHAAVAAGAHDCCAGKKGTAANHECPMKAKASASAQSESKGHEHGAMNQSVNHDCPMMGHDESAGVKDSGHMSHDMGHMDHAAGVDTRGDQAMGFSHATTTHHFRLLATGGAIEVTANDAADHESRDMIRAHLRHVSQAFAAGDFDLPMFIHDRVPPGVEVMKGQKDAIRYQYEELPAGGRVVIATTTPAAVEAIHDFLRFQIEDHRTGDATEVAK